MSVIEGEADMTRARRGRDAMSAYDPTRTSGRNNWSSRWLDSMVERWARRTITGLRVSKAPVT